MFWTLNEKDDIQYLLKSVAGLVRKASLNSEDKGVQTEQHMPSLVLLHKMDGNSQLSALFFSISFLFIWDRQT